MKKLKLREPKFLAQDPTASKWGSGVGTHVLLAASQQEASFPGSLC